jgi:hypothetical protein
MTEQWHTRPVTQEDPFRVGDTVTVARDDGFPREAEITAVRFIEYSEGLKLSMGAEGYYRYDVRFPDGRMACDILDRQVR